MHRDTRRRLYELAASGESTEERIARLAAAAPAEPVAGLEQTLPSTDPVVDLATVTMPELHDLVYAAASTYLQSLSQMTKTKAHTHAERIASMALTITKDHPDYMTRGADPRG